MGYTNPTGLSFMEQRVLVALAKLGETHPYELAKQNPDTLDRQALYHQLDRLEDKGFVRSKLRRVGEKYPRHKRFYWLTDAGRQALDAWRAAALEWTGSSGA